MNQMLQLVHLDRRPSRCMSGEILQGYLSQRGPQGRLGLGVPQEELNKVTRRKELRASTISTGTDVEFHLKINSKTTPTCASHCTVRKDGLNALATRLKLEPFYAPFCKSCPTIPQNHNKIALCYILYYHIALMLSKSKVLCLSLM